MLHNHENGKGQIMYGTHLRVGVSWVVLVALMLGVTSMAEAQLSGTYDLAGLGTTIPGVTFNGMKADDLTGSSAEGVGDVDGDGYDDLIIAALYGDFDGRIESGAVFLVYGGPTPMPSVVDLNDVGFTVRGAVFGGESAFDNIGDTVARAGDLNHDGLQDLLISGWGFPDPHPPKRTYIVYGRSGAQAYTGNIDLQELNVSYAGAIVTGVGRDLNPAGDFNHDGVDDIVVGPAAVIFGASGAGAPSGIIASTDIGVSTPGFRIGPDVYGQSVGPAGDVNGDGIDDVLVTDSDNPGGANSQAFVIYGKPGGYSGLIDRTTIGTTTPGFVINGTSNLWSNHETAGDFNGDGIDDILLSNVIIYGKSGTSTLTGALNANQVGTTVDGVVFDVKGWVTASGDFNDDGVSDVLIADGNADVFLVYGQSGVNALSGTVDLYSELGVTVAGARLNHSDNSGFFSDWVANAGDINGDGVDDILVGDLFASPTGRTNAGRVYLVYGQSAPSTPIPAPLGAPAGLAIIALIASRRLARQR